MMKIEFKENETQFIRMQGAFNDLLSLHYPDVLSWNTYQLWEMSEKAFTPQEWKEFKIDKRVSEWFDSEMDLIAKENIFKLLSKSGDTRSTANIQALGQLLNFQKQKESTQQQNTKIVYCFIPLNIYEEVAENVKILQTIPTQIASAIQFKGNK